MSRSPNSIDSPEPAPSSATPPPLRLQLDPNRPVEPDLDGAFWPHSHELSTELPPLLEALSTHLGQIAIVGYHRDAWDAAPGKLDVAGHAVHLQDFVSPNPPTVIVIADTGRRVTLRVVPPETDVSTAAQAMSVAAHASVEAATGGRATKADASEARSLEELAERLSRLPGNTAPEQGRADPQVGRRSRRPVHRCTSTSIRPDPRRAHRPRTTVQIACRSGRSQHTTHSPEPAGFLVGDCRAHCDSSRSGNHSPPHPNSTCSLCTRHCWTCRCG